MKLPRVLAFPAVLIVIAAALGCGTLAPDNDPPQIDALLVNGQPVDATKQPTDSEGLPIVVVTKGTKVVFQCNAHDRNSDPLDFTWTTANSSGDQPQNYATLDTPNAGRYTVTCVVRDGRDGVATKSAVIDVVDPGSNHSPTASLSPTSPTVAPGATQQFVCNATDPENDSLTFAYFAVRGTVVTNAVDPTKAVYTAPSTPGSDTVYCVVTDSKNNVTTVSSTVKVQ